MSSFFHVLLRRKILKKDCLSAHCYVYSNHLEKLAKGLQVFKELIPARSQTESSYAAVKYTVLSDRILPYLCLQTLLRIWDCFLLEGPKVLFRFSLAILKLHEREIIKKCETISVMRHLKACAKVTYDVDGLVQVSEDGHQIQAALVLLLPLLVYAQSPGLLTNHSL